MTNVVATNNAPALKTLLVQQPLEVDVEGNLLPRPRLSATSGEGQELFTKAVLASTEYQKASKLQQSRIRAMVLPGNPGLRWHSVRELVVTSGASAAATAVAASLDLGISWTNFPLTLALMTGMASLCFALAVDSDGDVTTRFLERTWKKIRGYRDQFDKIYLQQIKDWSFEKRGLILSDKEAGYVADALDSEWNTQVKMRAEKTQAQLEQAQLATLLISKSSIVPITPEPAPPTPLSRSKVSSLTM